MAKIKVTDTLEFPDIQVILEVAKDIDEVWELLIDSFKSDPRDLERNACANKLIELNNMRRPEIIQELDKEQAELKEVLRGISRRYGRRIEILRRQKDIIGIVAKMIRLIKDGEEEGIKVFASLERLHDFLGLRFVAQTGEKDTPESQKMCYEIMNEILTYLVVKKSHTLECLSVRQKKREFEGILVPEKSLILPIFKDNVKDYVKWIKPTKYQSLHAVPKNPNKREIEIQVRTEEMDIRAIYDEETGHDRHDAVRYDGIEIPVDLTKVNIRGFKYIDENHIYDRVGLVKSIDPLTLLD